MIDLKNTARDYGDEYAFGEDVEVIIPEIKHDIRPVWNQWKNTETKSACTIVWAVNQIIREFWLILSEVQTNKLYVEVVKYCVKNWWYVIWSWRWTPTATNYVCKRRNEIWYKTFEKEKVIWLRLQRNNEDIIEALEKWHIVWFTKYVNFASDQVEWLVYHEPDIYKKSVWHRLNRTWIKYITATWWADISKAERWAIDNYHWQIWEFFAFQELKKYINKWIYWSWYLILPESCSVDSIEKNKELIAKKKAYHVLISVMSSTYKDIESEYQMMSWAYATALRDKTNERPVEQDEVKKAYQLVVDSLSYAWKHAWDEEQKMYSELASYLRNKYNLK